MTSHGGLHGISHMTSWRVKRGADVACLNFEEDSLLHHTLSFKTSSD